MARVSDTLINTLFDGRYRILRKLGSGGMANVYLAEDEDLGRRVAIKILNDRYANDDLFIERFRREAKSAAGLSHPNIVSIYDRGEAEGTYYIAMEVIEGRSLKELILTTGALPVHQAVAYARQLLEALRFAHRHGIIHRDIKPHNVLVSADERAKGREERLKVTDFGIARHGASQMTEAGSIMGTAQYLSPEQARGAPVTAASDLYSAGIVLYEMLTGKVPFGGESAIEIAMKHVNELPKPPSQLRSEIPPELDKIVLRALAKEPEDRYQTAEDFMEDLDRVEAGLPLARETSEAATALLAGPVTAGTTQVLPRDDGTRLAPARPEAPPRRPPPYPPDYRYDERPPKRRRFLPWLLVLLLLAAAGLAGWYVYNQIQEQLEAREPVGVPDVVGLAEERAVERIEEAELEPNVERRPDPEVERGIVVEQSPQAGVRIQKGDQVTIVVSSGPRQVEIPRVVGMQFERAIQELDDAGLEWRQVEVFSRRPVGEVAGQNPRPGTSVPEGTRVTLRVSKGVETAAVPDVLQQSEESARAELTDAGFEVTVTEAPSDDVEAGLVSAQDPSPGVEATVGSTVTITVSTGPEQAEVPNVVGEDEESARQILEDAGFDVQVDEVFGPPPQEGLVVDQDPDGGTQADEGSTVTIVVARLEEDPGQGEGGDG
ncbi:MAG TPA: Stk1 family PASTA domain-containing Ser/Thr kinase [Gaiellaceae bacterium]|nr:Stk1 family PASTA domain-containing Ser/Thr kinase [Gaiellaceae bacterium]